MGLVLGIFGWGGLARAVRSQTLSLRQRGFLEAAREVKATGQFSFLDQCVATPELNNLMRI